MGTEREPKRAAFNTRLRKELKDTLQYAATKSGRSLSEEIEFRLEMSFVRDKELFRVATCNFGGESTYALLLAISQMKDMLNAIYGTEWETDHAMFAQFKDAIIAFLENLAPPEGDHPPRMSGLSGTGGRIFDMLLPAIEEGLGKSIAAGFIKQIAERFEAAVIYYPHELEDDAGKGFAQWLPLLPEKNEIEVLRRIVPILGPLIPKSKKLEIFIEEKEAQWRKEYEEKKRVRQKGYKEEAARLREEKKSKKE